MGVTNSLVPRPQPLENLGSTGQLPGATPEYFKSSYLETGFLGKNTQAYVPLPITQNTNVVLLLPDPPYQHLGQTIIDLSAQGLCRLYVDYLGNLVRDAAARFSA